MTPAERIRGLPSLVALLLAVTLLLVETPPLSAQRADFLFSRPPVTLALATGIAQPGEGSDVFSFTREQLTVKQGAFTAPFFMVELGIRVSEHIDLALAGEYAGSSVDSEMQDWVTQDDRPITQTTEFKRWRLTTGLKAYLLPRGRQISDFAWVPNPFSPYVGGGIGLTRYEFTQYGDFVDFRTWDIIGQEYPSEGSGWTPYALAGIDISMTPSVLLRTELRHYWGTGSIDREVWDDFEDIDLSGFRGSIGVAFRLGGKT